LGFGEDDKLLGELVEMLLQRWESDMPIQPINPVIEQNEVR